MTALLRLWRRITICWPRGHDWQADPVPTAAEWAEGDPWFAQIYTPSSTCRRCGARQF